MCFLIIYNNLSNKQEDKENNKQIRAFYDRHFKLNDDYPTRCQMLRPSLIHVLRTNLPVAQ